MFTAIALIGTVFVTPPGLPPPVTDQPACEITLSAADTRMVVIEALLLGTGWDGGIYVIDTQISNGSNLSRSVQSGDVPDAASTRLPVSLARVQTVLSPGTVADISLTITAGDRTTECHKQIGR